jgi:hypothetical protein
MKTKSNKYRGKEKSGEWRYGSYMSPTWTDYSTYIHGTEMIDGEHFSQEDIYEVIPETVGQNTNCKDKNGDFMWENDIVQYNEGNHEKPVYCDLTIEYVGNGFYAIGYDGFSRMKKDISVDSWRYEVVGNAWDGVKK